MALSSSTKHPIKWIPRVFRFLRGCTHGYDNGYHLGRRFASRHMLGLPRIDHVAVGIEEA
jgi:hypothetical protein